MLIGFFMVNCCIYGPCPSRRVSFTVEERKALDLMKVKRVGARDCDLQSRDGALVRRYLIREYD